MIGASFWWRAWLIDHGLAPSTSAVAGAFGLVVVAAFASERGYFVWATLFVLAPFCLYLLGGNGAPQWVGYGYLGALASAVLLARAVSRRSPGSS